MPGNDMPEIIHNFFNHDNSSQNQSQLTDGGWSVLNNNQRAGFQRQSGAQSSLHINNHTSQSRGLEHGNGMQPAQSFFVSNPTSKTDLVINQPSIMNGYMHNSQGSSLSTGQRLVHRNISPYERPEAPEAPVNFDFLGGQHQLMRSQHHVNPQPFQIQNQRINDMQLWQQQMMQQQLLLHMQQGRQLNTNQIQSAISGVPVNTVSIKGNNVWSNEHGNMNWVQRSTMQGIIPNGFMFSHDQDQSLNGVPAANTRDTLNHQSQFQGTQEISHDFASTINQNQQGGHTEEKLLFSAGGKENQETCSKIQDNLMQIDEHDSFPTMNSGSWSALMQDAVEASSSDTGINEEWSGLKLPSSTSNMQSLTSTLPLFCDADANSDFNQRMNFTSQPSEAAIYKTFDQQKQQLNDIANDVLVPQEQLHLHRQLRNNTNGWSNAQSVKPTVSKSFNYLQNNSERQHGQIHDTEISVNMGTQQTQESRHMAFGRNQVNYGKNAPTAHFLQNRNEETATKHKNEPSSFVYNDLKPGQNRSGNETQMLVNSSNMDPKHIGPHMLHYHPMGSVEMSNEPMGPAQSVAKHQDQRYVRQPQFLGRSKNDGSDSDSEKGHFSDLQRNKNASSELQYGGSDQSTSDYSQGLQAHSASQNMLELLDKVDQSAVVKPVEQNTQVDKSNSDSLNRLSSHFQPHQSSSYQEFGLKLAPPSQRQSFTDHFLSSQTPLHIGNGFIPRNADSGVNIKAPSHDASLKEENQGNITFLTGQKSKEVVHSNIQMTKQQLQWKQQQQQQQQYQHPQHQPQPRQQQKTPQQLHQQQQHKTSQEQQQHKAPQQQQQQQQHKAPQQQQQQQHKAPQQQQQHKAPQQQQQHKAPQQQQQQHKAPQQPPQQYQPPQQQQYHQYQQQQLHQKQNFGSQQESDNCQSSSVGTSNSQTKKANIGLNKPEIRLVRPSASSAVSQQGGVSKMLHNVWTNISSEQHITGVPPQKFISNLLQKPDNNHNKRKGEDSTSSPQLTDTENQSVKDNSSKQMPPPVNVEMSTAEKQHNNYSLLQQAQALKNVEPVPTQRVDNRLKGVDFSMNTSHFSRAQGQRYIYGQNTVLRETDTMHKISFLTDAKTPKLSSSDSKDNTTNTSHDRPRPNYIQNQSLPNISPQMAPLWFEKYGNCSNIKPKEDAYTKNENVPGQENVLSIISERKVNNVEKENKDNSNNTVSSPSHLVLSEAMDSDKIVTFKKRKSATTELVPWHTEVTHGLQKLPSISIMEQNWALSTNRLVDKFDDEIETLNDGVSTARPRRRLKLTTQLMQQILPSIPSTYISAKTATSYENVLYLVAKSVLGDACNLITSGIDSGSANKTSGNSNISKRESCNYFSRYVEEITARSKKVEVESLRLEERNSILDLRLQCEDLSKEAVMNRFVKFHGGYQSEGIRSSSVSDITPRKAYPQRQVTAHALPRNLPEVVNCILL